VRCAQPPSRPEGPRNARVERSESLDGGEHSAILIDVMAGRWMARHNTAADPLPNSELKLCVLGGSIQLHTTRVIAMHNRPQHAPQRRHDSTRHATAHADTQAVV
jgi:hypothetical protein